MQKPVDGLGADRVYYVLPQVGCFLTLAVLATFCLLTQLFVDLMQTALARLHLSPEMATLAMVGMLLGGLINLPLTRIQRDEEQTISRGALYGTMGWVPVVERHTNQTILAVNVGGCVVPVFLAIYLISIVLQESSRVQLALLIASAANIFACYRVARPIPGVGIAMPGFVSPIVSVGLAWLLLASPEFQYLRAPVAFVAGVAGPLIGADLLHCRDFSRISASVVSIGGAGTFDGIVLSGLLAALLA